MWYTPGDQGLSNMLVHLTHAQVIICMAHFTWLRVGLSHFIFLPWSITLFLCVGSERNFLYLLARYIYYFWVEVCIEICLSYLDTPGNCTFVINIDRKRFLVAFRPLKTSLPCPWVLSPWSIMILCAYTNIKSKYNTVAHLHFSSQPSVFYHIVFRLETN